MPGVGVSSVFHPVMRWLLLLLMLGGALIVLIAEHRKRRNIEG